jgi:hypothetical protein
MATAPKLWAWLGKPENRSTLGFLGAGLAAVVAAAWQLYLHFAPPAAPPPAAAAQPSAAQTQAAPPPDAAAVKTLQASQARTLNAEAGALDNIAQQIEAANPPPKPAAQGQ